MNSLGRVVIIDSSFSISPFADYKGIIGLDIGMYVLIRFVLTLPIRLR